MSIDAKTKFDLKKLIKQLKNYRGRHTELITVYIPAGFDPNITITQLQQEAGTATNIKSASTRNNVITALEKMIQFLKTMGPNPEHGIAVFSGNVSQREGGQDYQVFNVEPPVPLNQKLYRCDKTFVTEPLEEMIVDKEVYGLVVLDQRDATLALLKGKAIIPLKTTHSEVPGKMRAGGQCCIKGTLVQKEDGSLLPIEDIKVEDLLIGFYNDLKPSKVLDTWKKDKEGFIIKTKNPRRTIEASKDHIFFVWNNGNIVEKRLEELQVSDILLFPEKIETTSKEVTFTPQLHANRLHISKEGRLQLINARKEQNLLQKELGQKAQSTAISAYETGRNNIDPDTLKRICEVLDINYGTFLQKYCTSADIGTLPSTLDKTIAHFVGYVLGDGSFEQDRITLFEQREVVSNALKRKYDTCFNLQGSQKFRESKNYFQTRYTSRPLVRFIQKEFPELRKALDSSIPAKIMQSSNQVVASFIRGLFDAEGYVTDTRLGLGMNNKRIITQLQQLLLRFSIIASVHEYDNNKNAYSNKTRYTLDVTEKQSLKLFKKYMSFTSEEKINKLNDLIASQSNMSYVRQVLATGKQIRNIVGTPTRRFNNPGFFAGTRNISKVAFKNGIQALASESQKEDLDLLLKHPLLPTEIVSITKDKTVEMYDLATETQNFFANGLLVHNSAPRFQRLRADAINSHYKKIADYMKNEFLPMKGLKGIIIGGPSTSVHNFMLKDHVTGDLKKKIIGTKDLSYTGDFGLQELLERSKDLLAEEEVQKEKQIMQKFFFELSQNTGKASYGKEDVMAQIKMGAVEVVLVSEKLEDDEIEEFEEESELQGTTVAIISTDTREGEQLFSMGKVAAILRYAV